MGSDRDLKTPPEDPPRSTKPHSKDKDMGAALRSIYQKTIDESIPDEMLDLLGKLG